MKYLLVVLCFVLAAVGFFAMGFIIHDFSGVEVYKVDILLCWIFVGASSLVLIGSKILHLLSKPSCF
jgi:hypothetical protein